MSAISSEIRDRVVRLLIPFVTNQKERRSLVASMISSTDIHPSAIDLRGSASAFAQHFVNTLLVHERDFPTIHPLIELLGLIRNKSEISQLAKIDELIFLISQSRNALSSSISTSHSKSSERSTPTLDPTIPHSLIYVCFDQNDIVAGRLITKFLQESSPQHGIILIEKPLGRKEKDWWSRILYEINRCDIFVYILSNKSLESNYCQQQFREALRLRKLYVFVKIQDNLDLNRMTSDLRVELRQRPWLDISDLENGLNLQGMAKLVRVVKELTIAVHDQPLLPPKSHTPSSEPGVISVKASVRARGNPSCGEQLIIGWVIAMVARLLISLFSVSPTMRESTYSQPTADWYVLTRWAIEGNQQMTATHLLDSIVTKIPTLAPTEPITPIQIHIGQITYLVERSTRSIPDISPSNYFNYASETCTRLGGHLPTKDHMKPILSHPAIIAGNGTIEFVQEGEIIVDFQMPNKWRPSTSMSSARVWYRFRCLYYVNADN